MPIPRPFGMPAPILASLGVGGPSGGIPQVGAQPAQAAPQLANPTNSANPFQQPLNTGASLLDQLLRERQASMTAPAPLAGGPSPQAPMADPQADMTQGYPTFDSDTYRQQSPQSAVPAITPDMFQNPNASAARMQQAQQMQDQILQRLQDSQVKPGSTRDKVQKYGGAAGQILQGLGGIAAAMGPDGAAKGYNEYLDKSNKQAEERRKASAEERKNSVEALGKLADLVSKSSPTTSKNVEDILKAQRNESQVKLDQARAQTETEKANNEKLEGSVKKTKDIKQIMDAIASGSRGQKDVANAGAADALESERRAKADLTAGAKTDTEESKAELNKAKATQAKSAGKLSDIKGGTETAKQGLINKQAELTGSKTQTQGSVRELIGAKTAALKGKPDEHAKIEAGMYKQLPPGAVNNPKIAKVIAAMKANGDFSIENAARLVNQVKGMPQYQTKKKGGAPALPAY